MHAAMADRKVSGGLSWKRTGVPVTFLKPGRESLHARVKIDDDRLEDIRRELGERPNVPGDCEIPLTDRGGTPHAVVRDISYIGRRNERMFP